MKTSRMHNLAAGRTRLEKAGFVFRQTDGEAGLEVIDTIDRHRYTLQTTDRVAPEPSDTDSFLFP